MRAAIPLWPILSVRALLFAGLWLVIAGTEPGAWLIGVPAVAVAIWASLHLQGAQGPGLSAAGAWRFVGVFLWESLRGGVDVARRTLGPRLRIRPGFVRYRSRLPAGRPRVLFVSCVSLLPGTLTADLQGDTLLVHLLDTDSDAQGELRRLEDVVGGLFGQALEPTHD
jgi:multicomponent Na+:H+ antiporter subunit E